MRARRIHIRRRLVALGALLVALVLLVAASGSLETSNSKRSGTSSINFLLLRRIQAEELDRHEARQGRAIDALLKSRPVLRVAPVRGREVALTFDDGPGPYTSQILDTLIRLRAHATFFPVGIAIDEFPELIRREVEAGFAIGDHTENHARMAGLPPAEQRAELLQQAAAVRRQGASFPRLFRPPFGVYDATTLKLLRRYRMLMVLWAVETADYELPGDAAIVQHVLAEVRPGAVILLHDGGGDRSETVAALPTIIHDLRARGYRLVTVPELVLDSQPNA